MSMPAAEDSYQMIELGGLKKVKEVSVNNDVWKKERNETASVEIGTHKTRVIRR